MPSWLEDRLREVLLLQDLHHPNIVGYKHAWLETAQPADFGPSVPCLFILMDYCNAGNLLKFLECSGEPPYRFNKSPSTSLVWHLLGNLCSALTYLHSRQLVHRDIKPQNLLINFSSSQIESIHQRRPNKSLTITDIGEHEGTVRDYMMSYYS